MAYLYLDDSKHHRFGFSLAAFVICDTDPTEDVSSVFRDHGYDPGEFEYKSSTKMAGDQQLQALRDALSRSLEGNAKLLCALCMATKGWEPQRSGY
jgi:hypothetical protein